MNQVDFFRLSPGSKIKDLNNNIYEILKITDINNIVIIDDLGKFKSLNYTGIMEYFYIKK